MTPNGWEDVRLSDVAKVNPLRSRGFGEDTIVTFLAMSDVAEGGGILRRQERHASEVTNGYTPFQEGDILVAKITPCFENRKGTIARGLVSGYGFGSTEFHVLRAGPRCDPGFLYHLTMTHRFRRRGEANMTGSAGQKRVPTDFLKGYHFPLPPKHEQVEIADVLNTWDRCIRQTQELLEKSASCRAAIAQRVLTGKRRFPEFVKSDGVVETKYGLIPEEWKYVKVSEVAREVNARNGHGNDTAVLSCTKYDGLVDSLEYFGRQVFSDDTSNYKVVRCGQFAYATNHIEEGSIGLLAHRDAGLVSPMYTVFETTERVHAPFLYALFKTPLYLHLFHVHMDVSVNRRGGLRWSKMAEIPVALPSVPEQKKIAATLAAADREIDLLQRELGLLRKQKRSLMQELLTGKKRLRV